VIKTWFSLNIRGIYVLDKSLTAISSILGSIPSLFAVFESANSQTDNELRGQVVPVIADCRIKQSEQEAM